MSNLFTVCAGVVLSVVLFIGFYILFVAIGSQSYAMMTASVIDICGAGFLICFMCELNSAQAGEL